MGAYHVNHPIHPKYMKKGDPVTKIQNHNRFRFIRYDENLDEVVLEYKTSESIPEVDPYEFKAGAGISGPVPWKDTYHQERISINDFNENYITRETIKNYFTGKYM